MNAAVVSAARTVEGEPVKKLLLLVALVALGALVAKKVRTT